MKFHSKLVVAALAGILMAGAAAQAQEMKFFRIGTGAPAARTSRSAD